MHQQTGTVHLAVAGQGQNGCIDVVIQAEIVGVDASRDAV